MADEQAQGNGYLRQGEFRTWSRGVDAQLASINARMFEHGELLAVLNDRKTQFDTDRLEQRRLRNGVVVAALGSIGAVVSEIFHILKNWR